MIHLALQIVDASDVGLHTLSMDTPSRGVPTDYTLQPY